MMKMRRNFPIDSGALAKVTFFMLEETQHFVGAGGPDMGGASVGQFDIVFGVVRLLDPGIHFRSVEQPAQFWIEFDRSAFPILR